MTLMEFAVKAVRKKTKYRADLKTTASVKFSGPRRVLSKMAVPFVDKLILKSKNMKAMQCALTHLKACACLPVSD